MSDFDVFLSHNSHDKPAVRQLEKALQERGLKVWVDESQLVPGRPWQEALEAIISTTKSAAVLVGKDGLGPWESPEMRACLSECVDRRLPVIPVLLPGAGQQPDLPLFLKAFTWVDLRKGIDQKGLDRLVWGITGKKTEDDESANSTDDDEDSTDDAGTDVEQPPRGGPIAVPIVNYCLLLLTVLPAAYWVFTRGDRYVMAFSIALAVALAVVGWTLSRRIGWRKAIVDNPRTIWCACALLVFEMVVHFTTAHINLDSTRDTRVWITETSDIETGGTDEAWQPSSAQTLGSGRSMRRTFWLVSPWSPRRLTIKCEHRPDRELTLTGGQLVRSTFPDDFAFDFPRRPVVLIRPSGSLIYWGRFNDDAQLEITVSSLDEPVVLDYAGRGTRSVWIGCDRLVEVPPNLMEGFLENLEPHEKKDYDEPWRQPRELSNQRLVLKRGDTVTVKAYRRGDENKIRAELSFKVGDGMEAGDSGPQCLLLDLKKGD